MATRAQDEVKSMSLVVNPYQIDKKELVSMDHAKDNPVAGTKFSTPVGTYGVILPESSSRGKIQAEMTCTMAGCNESHTREISDWHQSKFCRTHSKKRYGRRSLNVQDPEVQGLEAELRRLSDEKRQRERTEKAKADLQAKIAALAGSGQQQSTNR